MLALFAVIAAGANAAPKKEAKKVDNSPVFTVIKKNPITSIKNQNRSGTCWDYSTLSYFEAEILKATGKTYDLSESFVANKTYMDRAIQVVRMHVMLNSLKAVLATTLSIVLKTMVSARRCDAFPWFFDRRFIV